MKILILEGMDQKYIPVIAFFVNIFSKLLKFLHKLYSGIVGKKVESQAILPEPILLATIEPDTDIIPVSYRELRRMRRRSLRPEEYAERLLLERWNRIHNNSYHLRLMRKNAKLGRVLECKCEANYKRKK